MPSSRINVDKGFTEYKKWELGLIKATNLENVTFNYKDGEEYTMTVLEFMRFIKELLMKGMLGYDHRAVMEHELIEK
jgi:hypothetical protein